MAIRADTDVQAWIDKSELAELVAVLSSAVDRGDQELIASCYAEDSYDDHGTFKGSGRQFAEFLCASNFQRKIHHLLGQSVFDVRGDEAWGETFFIFHGITDTGCLSGFGRYIDYFQRVSSRWKVKYRRVVPDQTIEGDDQSSYWQSSRNRDDPLYDRKRWPDG